MTKHKRLFIEFLQVAYGVKPDRYGHFQLTSDDGRQFRIKLLKTAWRLEEKASYGWANTLNTMKPRYYNAPDAIAEIHDRLKARGVRRTD